MTGLEPWTIYGGTYEATNSDPMMQGLCLWGFPNIKELTENPIFLNPKAKDKLKEVTGEIYHSSVKKESFDYRSMERFEIYRIAPEVLKILEPVQGSPKQSQQPYPFGPIHLHNALESVRQMRLSRGKP